MTENSTTTRRKILASGAAFAAVPLAAIPVAAMPLATNPAISAVTPISRLWATAEHLGKQLNRAMPQISFAGDEDGIPAWMRTAGNANAIGNKRYSALVGILNAEPQSNGDLAIMARAVLADDIQNGPRGWAAQRLAEATVSFQAAA